MTDSFFYSQRIIKLKLKNRKLAKISNSTKLKMKVQHYPLVNAIVSQFKINESELKSIRCPEEVCMP